MKEPRIILESFSGERDRASYSFSGIVEIIAAHTMGEGGVSRSTKADSMSENGEHGYQLHAKL